MLASMRFKRGAYNRSDDLGEAPRSMNKAFTREDDSDADLGDDVEEASPLPQAAATT